MSVDDIRAYCDDCEIEYSADYVFLMPCPQCSGASVATHRTLAEFLRRNGWICTPPETGGRIMSPRKSIYRLGDCPCCGLEKEIQIEDNDGGLCIDCLMLDVED